MQRPLLLSAALICAAAMPCRAQSAPAMAMPSPMAMPSSIDLSDPMSQEASGTSWLPSSSPVYAKMFMRPNGDMAMVHGAAMARYTDVGSKRGDRRIDMPNWAMGMYAHKINTDSQIGVHLMMSLDPITEGGYGYPLLYQTGETWHKQPLHDRQHPHDLFDELAVSYSHLLGGGKSAYLYLAYPGEPSLGPPTFMHRLLASDLADAPIGHHWQDATHITFGVATAGVNFGSKVKFEASDFTGREPDENRYSFDKPRFDSYSGRVSYNPDPDNSLQASYGFIKNPEGDGVNQHRITASWLYNRPVGADANFTTALVWGQNNLPTEGRTNSYLAEADYQRGRDTILARWENITKSGHELVLPLSLEEGKYNVNALTAGYVRDLTHGKGIDTGLGAAVTVGSHPASLNSIYGSKTPVGFQIYLRFRPSRLKMNPMQPPELNATSSRAAITAEIAPDPPTARSANMLTVRVTKPDGSALLGAKVTADVAMAAMDMGTTHTVLKDIGGGQYRGTVKFSMAGTWRMTVKATQPGEMLVSKSFGYDVK